MTATARTIPGSAMVGEGILAMLEGGFHHIPVTDATGDLIGVVTDTDLIGRGRGHPGFAAISPTVPSAFARRSARSTGW